MTNSETFKELNDFIKNVVSAAKENAKKKSYSGKLVESIEGDVKVSKNSINISLYMLPHGEFQDLGVKGANPSLVKNGKQKAPNSPFAYTNKMPPLDMILPWVKHRNMRFRDSKGRFKTGTQKSLAFVVRRSIYAQGIKPSLFLTEPFNHYFNDLPEEIIDKYGLDVAKFLTSTRKQNLL